MGSTKKVKSAGRYGSKYGVGIRKRLVKVESAQNKKSKCPKCGFKKIKRTAAGIFECRKCNAKFTGGAYFPTTLGGSIVRKMVSQKTFLPNVKELIAVTENKTAIAVESKTGYESGEKEETEKDEDGRMEKKHAKEKHAEE